MFTKIRNKIIKSFNEFFDSYEQIYSELELQNSYCMFNFNMEPFYMLNNKIEQNKNYK